MLNRRIWILSPLLSVGLVLAVIYTAQAALLKDIRVGEYDSFTRIVFELDAPVQPEQIVPLYSDQLAVVFADTSAGLVRKIPVERSRHIKNIRIWEKTHQLRAVLQFDFNSFRHESFALSNPPRIVLDIQPIEGAASTPATVVPAAPPGRQEGAHQVADTVQAQPLPSQAEKPAKPIQQSDRAGVRSVPDRIASFDRSIEYRQSAVPSQTSTIQDIRQTTGALPRPVQTQPPKPASLPNRLQFYLVVGLVLITIIILALLLLMLLSKHRWAEDKSQLSTHEFLQNQEKHIASLDARIQEQLKRYEEA